METVVTSHAQQIATVAVRATGFAKCVTRVTMGISVVRHVQVIVQMVARKHTVTAMSATRVTRDINVILGVQGTVLVDCVVKTTDTA